MEREKDKWVNETLESLEGIKPAIPSAALHQKIMQGIDAEKFGYTISMQTVYRIAAAIAVIISLNAYSCIVFSKNMNEKKVVQAFAKQYSLSSAGDGLINI